MLVVLVVGNEIVRVLKQINLMSRLYFMVLLNGATIVSLFDLRLYLTLYVI